MSVKIKSWVSILALIGIGFNHVAFAAQNEWHDSSVTIYTTESVQAGDVDVKDTDAVDEQKSTSTFPILIFDTEKYPDKTSFPKNFRTGNSWFKKPRIAKIEGQTSTTNQSSNESSTNNKEDENLPSRKGLENLYMSGSAQFSIIDLKNMLGILSTKHNANNIYIVDLRQESHGFLDNTPISWYGPHNDENSDKSGKEIKQIEDNLLRSLRSQDKDNVTVYLRNKIISPSNTDNATIVNTEGKFTPKTVVYRSVMDEEEVASRNNVKYFRIYAEDHYPPRPDQVDEFLSFVKKTPKNHWLHFHCLAGQGRTTTFMVMLDIIRNGHQVTLEDIVKRQFLMGGDNLFDTQGQGASDLEVSLRTDRQNFIKTFYQYVNDKTGYAKQNWSTWQKQKESIPAA